MSQDVMGFVVYSMAMLRLQDAKVKLKYKKDSRFWRGWAKFVKAMTFGRVANTNELTTTTVGQTIWLCDHFDAYDDRQRAEILIHELVHCEQYRKMTIPGFLFVYLFAFLPIGLAYGRYWIERTAYAYGYQAHLIGKTGDERAYVVEKMCKEFADLMASGLYGWPWPFKKATAKWLASQLG